MIGEDFDGVLEGARNGEHPALEAVYRDLAPTVLGYLRGQGASEPEDLTSEVFVAVVRQVGGFRGDERAFRSWVFTIAHRRLVDERRRLSRRREGPVDPQALAESAGPGGDVVEDALGRIGTDWALRSLGRLTGDQRAVLLLRVLAGLSVAEVASVLGKTQGAVKTLQRRALAALARSIEREAVSP